MFWLKLSTQFLGTSLCVLVLAMAAAQANQYQTEAIAALVLGLVLLLVGQYLPPTEHEEEE